jgi:outer membrane protein TolC
MCAETQVMAAKELNVEDAVVLAFANNASLKQAAISLEAKRRALGIAWNEALPSLTASGGLYQSGTVSSAGSSTTYGMGELSLSLSLSASFGDDMKLAKLNYESQLLGYQVTRNALELSIRKSFYNILLDTENLKQAKQNIEREDESYKQTEDKYKAGLASELDYLTAKVNLETLKPKEDAYATTLENDMETFKNALGLDQDDDISLTGSLDLKDGAIRQIIEQAMAKRPTENLSVATASKTLEIAKITHDSLYKSKLMPSLALSAFAEPLMPLVSTTGNTSSAIATSATLALSFPVGNFVPGSSAQESIAEAKDSEAVDDSKLADSIKTTQVSRKSDKRSVENYQSTLSVLKLNVDLTQRAYDAAKAAYDKGLESLTDLQSAEGNLDSAKLSALTEAYDLIAAILELESETGLPLETIGRL